MNKKKEKYILVREFVDKEFEGVVIGWFSLIPFLLGLFLVSFMKLLIPRIIVTGIIIFGLIIGFIIAYFVASEKYFIKNDTKKKDI